MKHKNFKTLMTFALSLVTILSLNATVTFADSNPTQYTINAIFNENAKNISATETIKFKNIYSEPLNEFVFHLYADSYNSAESLPSIGENLNKKQLSEDEKGDITLSKVLINGSQAIFTQENQILKFALPTPLKPNDEIEVTLDFNLKIPKSTARLGYIGDEYAITNWYPILSIYNPENNTWDETPFSTIGESNYSDTSNYTVTLEAPSNIVVASTGAQQEIIKDNKKIVTMNAQNVRDFVFMMSKNYKVVSKLIGDITLNSYYLEDKEDSGKEEKVLKMLDTTAKAVEFFSSKFGKYPYPQLHVVETHLSGGAMEYPQLIQMGQYLPSSNKSIYTATFETETAVHETAHQWWYVTVGNNEFKEPMLDESLTTFSTAYFFEKNFGVYNQHAVLPSLRDSLYPDENPNASLLKPINSRVDAFKNWGEYSRLIYSKGPLVFEDLRNRVGEDQFIAILQKYFQTYRFKNASVEGLLNTIATIAGDDIKEVMSNALSSPSYYPKALELSAEERTTLKWERKKNLLSTESQGKTSTFSNFLLKGMNGETILMVKPSNLSTEETLTVAKFETSMQQLLKTEFGITLSIKTDKEITSSEIKDHNLMIIGNPWNNSVFAALSPNLPVTISQQGIYTGDTFIKNSDITGQFVAPNPNNSTKLVLSQFWTDKPKIDYNYMNNYNLPNDMVSQFIITISDTRTFSGSY